MAGTFSRQVPRGIGLVLQVGLALLALGSPTFAQDNGAPVESKTGTAAASTYAPDKIETVNLANGNLSINVPLANIGGRGSASYTLSLSYNSKLWSAQHDKEETGVDPGGIPNPYVHHYYAFYDNAGMARPNAFSFGGGWAVSLGPAVSSRLINIAPHQCSSGHGTCYRYKLTKLNLVLPDGSEIELRDALTDGAPYYIGSSSTAPDRDRGRVWKSSDGSAVTYVTDAANGVVNGQYAGWVFLPDGTRLRMESFLFGTSARCTKIIDRNGNFVTIDYENPQGVTYTDTLGRQVVFLGDAATATASIRIKGYMGVPDQVVSVDWGIIGALTSGVADNLREDFRSLPRPFTSGDYMRTAQGDFPHTILTPHTDLFDGSEGAENIDERYAVTRVNLLDGRSIRFRYNQYGEVAEVIYPGGGVSRIDYEGFPTSMCDGISPFRETLDRRVVRRRLLTDGANVDATWIYGQGTGTVGGTSYPTGTVEARHGDGTGGALLLSETHYFLALKAEFRTCRALQSTLDFSSDGTHYEKWQNAKEFRVEKLTGSGMQLTVREWQQRAPVVWGNDPGLGYNTYVTSKGQEDITNDTRVAWEETTLENGKKKRTEYGYDGFNNVTSVKDYDFGDTSGNVGALLRQTTRTYASSLNGYCYSNLNGSDGTCGSTVASDANAIIHQRRLVLNETIKDAAGNQKAYSEGEYDNYSTDSTHAPIVTNSGMIQYDGARFSLFSSGSQPRGNVTKVARWAGASNFLNSFSQYNNSGNVIWTKDPNGNITTVSFTDNFGDGANPDTGSSGANGLTYAFATIATNALGHQAKTQFDYTRGVPTGSKDPNGVISKTEYDLLGRSTRVTAAVGLSVQTIAEITYPTASANVATTSNQLDATRWVASKTILDGFDRAVTTWQSEDGQHASVASFTIRVDTIYDVLGRVRQTSNPFRPSLGETAVYTTTGYDLASRVTSVTTPDNAVVTTGYSGNTVTVTDQIGKARKSVTDALGRLKEVYEDPLGLNYLTSYSYDVLDNLTTVSQGSQTRTFVYDSLKRLTSATNPESGTISYQYDNNGNLTQKTDARGVISIYAYDALNRNTTVDYSDTTGINPDNTRIYDTATNGKGRLRESYAGGNETVGANVEQIKIQTYDALGRPVDQRQRFKANSVWSAEYQTQRGYNLAGGVTSQTYPSGRTVSYSYDNAGRTNSFTGNLGDGANRTYSTGIIYSSLGGMAKEQFGTDTPVYNKSFYNSRGQLSEIRVGTTYTGPTDSSWNRGAIINHYSNAPGAWGATGGGPDNNGNLKRQEHWIPKHDQPQPTLFEVATQEYDYDNLNRLQRVHEGTMLQQEYVYDRWGNRTIHQTNTWGLGVNKEFTVNTANNRLGVPGGQSGTMSYDNAGNLTTDTYTGAGDRVYDAENRMTKAWGGNNQWQEYTYNADGQRMRRKLDGVETWQVYGIDGELLAEYPANGGVTSPQKEYGYRNGQLLITAEAGSGSVAPVFGDDFNDNSLDANKWTVSYPQGTPPVTEQSQQLQMTLAPNTAGYNGVYSSSTYDLTGRMAQVEVAQAVSQGGWAENFFNLELDAQNSFLISTGSTSIIFRSRVNGVNDQAVLTYDATAHRHWRVRHDQSANTINFETSADGTVWITRKTVTSSFALTSLRFYLMAGAWGTGNGSPGAAKYDNFKLLASTAGSSSVTVANAGFETPAVGYGNFQYGPTGGSWTFAGGTGVSASGSGFTSGGVAPEGSQIAFIQGGTTSVISQSISGFQSSTSYIITFAAAQRSNCCNAGGQDFQVYLDTNLLGTFHPASGSYADYSTSTFTTTVGAHTLKFVGLNPLGGDQTAFIDNVRVTGSALPGYGLQWLVSDQLGTPRMIFDQTGSLANVKRHDYLPFGEELIAGQGGRTPALGYTADAIRQKFTQKERDIETGLDYFLARYYSSTSGRFTSPDRILVDQWQSNPQSWNLYSYVRNNPLRLNDPTGNIAQDPATKTGTAPECWPKCPLPPGESPVFNETVTVTADEEPITTTALLGARIPRDSIAGKSIEWFGIPIGPTPIGGSVVRGGSGIFSRLLTWLFGRPGTRQVIGTVTREAIEIAAADAGPTVQVFTNQSGALQAGRGIYLTVGEGAEAMAGAARTGGQMYVGRIPKALVETLRSGQLLDEATLVWKGANARAGQYYIDARASEFVTPFLKPIP